ncbi:MAG TPA: hypothetical protein VGH53_22460 [Streptosporangiaceae bacterium]|jgi:hypothetical protein
MAKNMMPMKAGGGALGKVISLLVVLAVLALVVQHPADAAGWAIGAVHLIGRIISGIGAFLRDALG